MPTEGDNGSEVQTEENPTGDDNAKKGTEDVSELKKELEDAKKRVSDARKKMDEATIESKKLREENLKLKKFALGEEEEQSEEKPPEYLTKEEFNTVLRFELAKEDEIDLNREGYDGYRSKGYSPQDSLRLAHLDKGITSTTMSNHLQARAAQSGASTDRSDAKNVSAKKFEELKQWGISEETYLKHRSTVEKR